MHHALFAVFYNFLIPRIGGVKLELAPKIDSLSEIKSVPTVAASLALAVVFTIFGLIQGILSLASMSMAKGFNREDTIYDPLSFYFYRAVENLRLTLDAGVTSVRDAGLADAGVKMAIEKGLIMGPRIQICVTPLSITGGHFDFWLKSGYDIKVAYPGYPDSICDGVEGVRKKVREVLRAGAEVIKVMPALWSKKPSRFRVLFQMRYAFNRK